ncbi:MAG TPA: SRPBCC domain-containing protein [Symbiobacteriaceae bacterium]|jgi:hypothetical protein
MHVDGQFKYQAPPEVVYQAFTNPEALLFSVPGLQSLEPDGPDRFQALVKVGIGGFSLVYHGLLTVTDRQPAQGYRLLIDAETHNGFARGEAQFQFLTDTATGGTVVSYTGDVALGGGQKLLPSLAKGLADFFLRGMDQWLLERAPAPLLAGE